jgi:hypothetical protein
MNRAALDALMRELNKEGVPQFAHYTYNRLRNEDPEYAFLVDYFANQCAKEFGPPGFENAKQIGVICHRALELAEQYKDDKIRYSAIVEDPAPTVQAIKEAGALIDLVMIRSRNGPK